jgi:hypothetical protein
MARQIINLGAVPGDKTGAPAHVGGRIINENFEELYGLMDVLTRIDIISAAKGFSISGTDITVNADWQWYIDNVLYTNPDAAVLSVDLSSSGMFRKVYVVPNDANGFDLIEGGEAASNPPTPELPYGGMYVTFFEVSDSGIGIPSDPYNGDSLVNKTDRGGYTGTSQGLNNRIDFFENYGLIKQDFAWYDVNETGVVTDLELIGSVSQSIRFIGDATELQSLFFDPGVVQPYSGSLFYFKNAQANAIKLPHEELDIVTTANRYIWAFPDATDLVVQPGQIIQFKLNSSGNRGKIELVGISGTGTSTPLATDAISGTVKTDIEEVDPVVYTKTTTDALLGDKADLVAGFIPSYQLPAYVDDIIDGYLDLGIFYEDDTLTTVITGEVGKIYVDLTSGQSSKQYRWSGSVYIQITNGLIASTADVPDSTNKRYVDDAQLTVIGNTSGTNSGNETAASIATINHAATAKTTLVDADEVYGGNSVSSFSLIRIVWSDVWTYIKSKADTQYKKEELMFALSDEATDLTVGTLITFRMPFAMTLTSVKASVNTAPTVSSIIVDVKESGSSIFSTLLSIDATTKTSVGSAAPAVISDTSLADNAEITISTTQVGSGTVGKGLKLTLIGTRT